MSIYYIKKSSINEEIDHLLLRDTLKDYVKPRDKITRLLKSKTLLRVKKGLYVFGEELTQKPYHKETLANLIYGPSAISLEYALAFYHMIPERVEILTSITNKKDKVFKTPLGIFSYRYINIKKYAIGITQLLLDKTHPILIATREKALADVLTLTPNLRLKNVKTLETYLFEDLRIEKEQILSLNRPRLRKITAIYKNHHVNLLLQYLENHYE
ncbi:MAG: hypothetical protein JW855_01000 [Gammaproteobacteria bacterium]|nr:hypothetical protein [Gammaproteobacteria bacterium]